MSEPGPESVPTSRDRRSERPTKKRALTPSSAQSAHIDALFANPDRVPTLPSKEQSEVAIARKVARNAPPEIVANVQGSSAGAGSGEFHVYKASRRREYERLRAMDEEVKKEQDAKDWDSLREDIKKKDAAKTSKNKARRDKAKLRKEKAKRGVSVDADEEGEKPVKKSLKPMLPPERHATENGDEAGDGGEVQEEQGLIIHDED